MGRECSNFFDETYAAHFRDIRTRDLRLRGTCSPRLSIRFAAFVRWTQDVTQLDQSSPRERTFGTPVFPTWHPTRSAVSVPALPKE